MKAVSSKAKILTSIIRPEHLVEKAERADRVLSGLEGWPSRSQLKLLMEKGRVLRGQERIAPKTKLSAGDRIHCHLEELRASPLMPVAMDLRILFEDEDLLVVYKPRGLSVHPGAGDKVPTLVHGLLGRGNTLSDGGLSKATERSRAFALERPGIVHRLDKDTEGILVVAKNNEAHEKLSAQFRKHTIDRRYWALVWGRVPRALTIEARMARHPHQRKKMTIVSTRESTRGKESVTHIRALKVFEEFSWIECELETGRTHQIRVHLSSKGFPVLGDPLYGRSRPTKNPALLHLLDQLKGQALVAYRLGFQHPRTGKSLLFAIEEPAWLRQVVESVS